MLAAADGIVAVDERGIIRFCNPAAGELFARPTEELLGTPFGFPIVPGAATEIDLMLPGGRSRVVEMRITATTVESATAGSERLYVAALHDVTRRRQAEHDLEAALERQNIVVAMAAHELHNPLTAISALVHVLRDRRAGLAEDQWTEIINRIADRTVRLQALVRKFLTASRIDVNGARATAELVGILPIVLELLSEMDERAQDVRLSGSPEIMVLVDRGELFEMLANYLENAFAYGHPPIEVRADGNGDWVEISVSDSGPGVPAAFVPRLFERFSRAPEAEQQTEGSGLGLWIVRSLARANGGAAWYEPHRGGGARFCLRLPQAPTS